ncbi:hypothetical protein AWH04_28280 [Rhodococcus erythropolis]|nr:hypothetical protein A5N83_03365 [Rhodococcus sp. 1139]RGP45313.1 hypothetical protein AWH04_28280 [Rhodococcus erythropolis]
MNECLIIKVKLSKLRPTSVVVQPDVRNYVALIVRMLGSGLLDYAHDSADELNVRGKTAEGSENGCDAKAWMIEAFAQHLNLHDAVKLASPQPFDDGVLAVGVHPRVNLSGPVVALVVNAGNLSGVVD